MGRGLAFSVAQVFHDDDSPTIRRRQRAVLVENRAAALLREVHACHLPFRDAERGSHEALVAFPRRMRAFSACARR